MTAKKHDEEEPEHKPHHAAHPHKAHKPHGKAYTVTCQDGSETTLTLEKTGGGEYPSAEDFQRWFKQNGDKRDGKCCVAGCAVCIVTEG